MICPNCGLDCEDNQDTCPLCGYSFTENPAPADTPHPEAAVPQSTEAPADTAVPVPKKKNTAVIVLAILVAVLVLAGAAMAVLLLRPNDNGESQTAASVQTTLTTTTTEATTTTETTTVTTTEAATTTQATTTTTAATEAATEAAEAAPQVLSGSSFRVEKGTAFSGEVFCMDVTWLGQSKSYVENALGASLSLEDWQWWGNDLKAAFITYNNLDIALFFQNDIFVMAYYDCNSSVSDDIAAAQDFVFPDYPASSNGVTFGEAGYLEIYEEVYAETGEYVTRQRYVSYDMY